MDEFAAIEDNFTSFAKHLAEDRAVRFSVLRSCSFFDPVPDEWLMRISDMAKIKTFYSDVCLTSEEDEMNAFYVILLGTAEAYRNNKLVGTIDTGECFGEAVFFTKGNAPSSATVIADFKIIAAEFDKAAVDSMQADAEAKTYMDRALLLALYKKLQGANRKIEELLL
ncbi:MAG: cyclic nucleotide-binding domain-containing protein [Gallionella sp.]|nr:cyclic nucleotide-binding domain-containing protein [Gallionella sp.]